MTLNISSSEHKNGDDITAGNLNAPHNEIVNYINTNINSVIYIDSDTTKTVGSGGDFGTLQEAINYFSTVVRTTARVGGTILLKSGFILDEGVLLSGMNLGWVTIESEDPIVYVNPNAAFGTGGSTNPVTQYHNIISYRGQLPTINTSFEAQNHNVSNYTLLTLTESSFLRVISGNKILNDNNVTGNKSIQLNVQSTFIGSGCTFNDMEIKENSYAFLENADCGNIRLLSFATADISRASYASINVTLNAFDIRGLALDRSI